MMILRTSQCVASNLWCSFACAPFLSVHKKLPNNGIITMYYYYYCILCCISQVLCRINLY